MFEKIKSIFQQQRSVDEVNTETEKTWISEEIYIVRGDKDDHSEERK